MLLCNQGRSYHNHTCLCIWCSWGFLEPSCVLLHHFTQIPALHTLWPCYVYDLHSELRERIHEKFISSICSMHFLFLPCFENCETTRKTQETIYKQTQMWPSLKWQLISALFIVSQHTHPWFLRLALCSAESLESKLQNHDTLSLNPSTHLPKDWESSPAKSMWALFVWQHFSKPWSFSKLSQIPASGAYALLELFSSKRRRRNLL